VQVAEEAPPGYDKISLEGIFDGDEGATIAFLVPTTESADLSRHG
jgi:hypothetical protein